MILERALDGARHIEVQVFADRHGHAIHLGERDCSVQRRHQKLIEEAPSPAVDAALRERLAASALAAVRAIGYEGAGTVEFLLDRDGRHYFIEMNTRLQVEHPVTEAITGLDLVEWQFRVAAGEPLPLAQDDVRFEGHAIEVRLCAEDAAHGFMPASGTLALWQPPAGLRVEHALHSGMPILPFYDSMIAKLVAHGRDRDEARRRLVAGLDALVALGVPTNRRFLSRCSPTRSSPRAKRRRRSSASGPMRSPTAPRTARIRWPRWPRWSCSSALRITSTTATASPSRIRSRIGCRCRCACRSAAPRSPQACAAAARGASRSRSASDSATFESARAATRTSLRFVARWRRRHDRLRPRRRRRVAAAPAASTFASRTGRARRRFAPATRGGDGTLRASMNGRVVAVAGARRRSGRRRGTRSSRWRR